MTAPAAATASVSLDLDNLWSYLKTHGDPGWEERPSYLATFLPLVLDLLDEMQLRITFFVVGVDAAREEHAGVLRTIVTGGHEVGNHSHEHEPWLHRYSRDRLEEEVARAEEAISSACGARPRGFRGPGFSWSPDLLGVLAGRGYRYDASTLPTYLGPLARAYYFRTARLSAGERRERAALFGTFRDGFRPVRPYRWALEGGTTFLEIPVTTMPVFKTPFHLSYLLYLARVSETVAFAYLEAALRACWLAGTGVSFLLHPLDFLGGDEVSRLRFFPGMDLPGARKRRFAAAVLRRLGRRFELVPVGEHARILDGARLTVRSPGVS